MPVSRRTVLAQSVIGSAAFATATVPGRPVRSAFRPAPHPIPVATRSASGSPISPARPPSAGWWATPRSSSRLRASTCVREQGRSSSAAPGGGSWWTDASPGRPTAPAAAGVSLIAGSIEDSPGLRGGPIPEGVRNPFLESLGDPGRAAPDWPADTQAPKALALLPPRWHGCRIHHHLGSADPPRGCRGTGHSAGPGAHAGLCERSPRIRHHARGIRLAAVRGRVDAVRPAPAWARKKKTHSSRTCA